MQHMCIFSNQTINRAVPENLFLNENKIFMRNTIIYQEINNISLFIKHNIRELAC